jgi:hypothetical protein
MRLAVGVHTSSDENRSCCHAGHAYLFHSQVQVRHAAVGIGGQASDGAKVSQARDLSPWAQSPVCLDSSESDRGRGLGRFRMRRSCSLTGRPK